MNYLTNSPFTTMGGPMSADRVGFTAPARIWPKIDEIEASAAALNRDIQAYVGSTMFRAAWDQWYRDWRDNYYLRYQSTLQRLGALAGSDQLDANVENQREQLRGWYERYSQQAQANGQRVPAPSGQAPLRAPDQGQQQQGSSWSLPWWFWTLLGAGALYAGYRVYKTYQTVKERQRVLEQRFVPALLERYGLPGREGGEVLAAGHDPNATSARDYLSPFSLAYYARDAQTIPAGHVGLPDYGGSGYGRDVGYGSMNRDTGRVSSNFAYDRSRDPLADRF